jgi:hydrogenase small subunit
MSLLETTSPDLSDLFRSLDIEVVWHPTLSVTEPARHQEDLDDLLAGRKPLDFFCVEGAVIRGPGGTGLFDTTMGRPKKDLVAGLARRARFILAVGTCASYGGIGADGEIEATGLQFLKEEKGGFLGAGFLTGGGLPVINLPGCPCHPDVTSGVLAMLSRGEVPTLTEWNSPRDWYGLMVHQGCTRNEYHEYRVEEEDFGEKGCLFFHLGCHGPLAPGPCNKVLWNRRSSKTRAGVPCFGCTRPDFPQPYAFFRTRNIEGIPLSLPKGVDRPHYLAYKGMAAAAAPKRLIDRKTDV